MDKIENPTQKFTEEERKEITKMVDMMDEAIRLKQRNDCTRWLSFGNTKKKGIL